MVTRRAECITLAVETAIGSGSLALIDGDCVLGSVCGSGLTSRAEDILPNIEFLLNTNEIQKGGISQLAISTGPGSYTGLRIGIATILGLGKALGIEIVGIPLFTALVHSINDSEPYLAVVPMGRNDICFEVRRSNVAGAGPPRAGTPDELKTAVKSSGVGRVYAHSNLVERLKELSDLDVEITDLGANMAEYIGRAAKVKSETTGLIPIYVQNPRFG